MSELLRIFDRGLAGDGAGAGDGGRPGLDADALASAVGGSWLVRPAADAVILGASIDSRGVRPGHLFFALAGTRVDGHAFVGDAARAGASAVVVSRGLDDLSLDSDAGIGVLRVASPERAMTDLARAYRRALGGVRVIGVTGSNGKTTTVRLLHAALAGAGQRGTHAQKSQNNHLGVPLTMLNARPGDDYLICEVGTSGPGEIGALTDLVRPDVAVITSIGRAHIENLKSVRGIAAEKAALVRGVPAGGVAVVTGDSPELASELGLGADDDATDSGARPACTLVRVGTSERCDVRVTDIRQGPGWTGFRALGLDARVPLPGAHNASNGAIALAVAQACGADAARAALGLASAVGPEMRLERSVVRLGDASGSIAGRTPVDGEIVVINDAYNANPESVLAAIKMLGSGVFDPAAGAGRPRRIAILGDMLELGPLTGPAHREIVSALSLEAGIDLGIFVGRAFAEAVGENDGGNRPGVVSVGTGDEGLGRAAGMLQPGDVVLLKASRGMRLERLLAMLDGAGAGSVGGG